MDVLKKLILEAGPSSAECAWSDRKSVLVVFWMDDALATCREFCNSAAPLSAQPRPRLLLPATARSRRFLTAVFNWLTQLRLIAVRFTV